MEITGRVVPLAASFMSHLPLLMAHKTLSNARPGSVSGRKRFRLKKTLDSVWFLRQRSEGVAWSPSGHLELLRESIYGVLP